MKPFKALMFLSRFGQQWVRHKIASLHHAVQHLIPKTVSALELNGLCSRYFKITACNDIQGWNAREVTMIVDGLRRMIGHAVVAAACALIGYWAPNAALAQNWPTRNITVVVPLAAGSATDVVTRIVMDQLGKQLGRTIIVENRPGAGGTIGANMVAKSAPDGYTVLAYGALAIANALYSKIPYDTLRDFIPLIALGQQPLVVVTAPAKGYKTLGDLIAAAKAKPGALNYTSAGIGSASHFAAERLLASSGIAVQHIAFKGASEAATDIIAGRADFTIQPITTTIALIGDGQLVPLAVSAGQRATMLPVVPTTVEAGLPADSVYLFWSGLFLPANTPRDVVDTLYRETAAALQTPAVQAQLAKLGVEPMKMTLEQFAKFFRDDVEANLALVKAANIPRQ
jgi:tripartite-type tricarboxylate transporter receptor subunit TctC